VIAGAVKVNHGRPNASSLRFDAECTPRGREARTLDDPIPSLRLKMQLGDPSRWKNLSAFIRCRNVSGSLSCAIPSPL